MANAEIDASADTPDAALQDWTAKSDLRLPRPAGRLDERTLGSLAWGRASGGRMSPLQKARLVHNLAWVQIREKMDLVRQKLGLLRPVDISIDELAPPATSLTSNALAHAQETHELPLLHHSWRTYYFGALIAAHDRLDYDRELFFAAAILHDLGLTGEHEEEIGSRCFAVTGAIEAVRHLSMKGHSHECAYAVGEAISLHLNMHLPPRRFGPEAFLVSRGAVCDLFGAGHRRMTMNAARQILYHYPREGVIEALRFETANHAEGSRPAFMTKLFGRKAPKTPFDRM